MTSPHFETVQRIFADILEIPAANITPTSTPDTLTEWDSIRHMNLILSIEGELGIEFTVDEMEAIHDMPGLLKTLDAKRAA